MDISIFGKGKMGIAIGDNLQFLIVRLKKLSTNMQTSLMVK